MKKTITLALTGASGLGYAMRLLESLLADGHTVYLVYSQAAQFVAMQELDMALPARTAETRTMLLERFKCRPEQLHVFAREDWMAPIASGTGAADAMVVCPCTMGALSAIANGSSENLIERAADVMIKEGRKLILVPRETPFSPIHLENMLKLSRIGVTMLAANPGFYHRPSTVQDVIDFIVAKILDQLGIEHDLMAKWGDVKLAD
jgi:4-hydroxy-3-polyprenylbenzoate decarboxylase